MFHRRIQILFLLFGIVLLFFLVLIFGLRTTEGEIFGILVHFVLGDFWFGTRFAYSWILGIHEFLHFVTGDQFGLAASGAHGTSLRAAKRIRARLGILGVDCLRLGCLEFTFTVGTDQEWLLIEAPLLLLGSNRLAGDIIQTITVTIVRLGLQVGDIRAIQVRVVLA